MAGKRKTVKQKAEKPPPRIHIVRRGDTLRSISIVYLGTQNRGEDIKALNGLENDTLVVDSELVIPDR